MPFICTLLFVLFLTSPAYSLGLGESVQVSESGVVLSDGYGGPLPSSVQIAQLGSLINNGFNQEATVLAMLVQELAKKSLDTEALLKGIGEYFNGLEVLLKDLQKGGLTQKAAYDNSKDDVFGKTPFHCSDALTASALQEARKTMRTYTNAMKESRTSRGEGTQATESKAEASVSAMLFSIMAENMTSGSPDAYQVPSGASLFPFSGVINSAGAKIFQAVIHAVNSEPAPALCNVRSISGRRALELQGIKMGRIAGIQEGMQVAFDLQNPVVNGQAFSEMQREVNRDVEGSPIATENYIEGAYKDTSGGISILQAVSHQFERSRIANPDWYAKIDKGGMNEQGLLRELIKIEAWRGYVESLSLRISMVNAYNLAQLTAIMMEKHDNTRMATYIYPPGESPTGSPK